MKGIEVINNATKFISAGQTLLSIALPLVGQAVEFVQLLVQRIENSGKDNQHNWTEEEIVTLANEIIQDIKERDEEFADDEDSEVLQGEDTEDE